jgi:UDP-N-acetylmuramoylalanine-D-glutamate ligase
MHISAVTGTNGKTTVSQLLAQLIRAAAMAAA